jgi:Protein of unknown function DUF262
MTQSDSWADDPTEALFEDDHSPDEPGIQIDTYDLASAPNDFNVSTIYNFIETGAVRIPAFQRNYVWDIKRASRLIESLIIGLPVPQIFLYEENRNVFQVIDGQQRLMTIYYFIKGRFPRMAKRGELRQIFDLEKGIPPELLNSNEYFDQFKLKLPQIGEQTPNLFTGMTYDTLNDYKIQFDLRTIRNIIVKQVRPSDDHSSIYEMFNRLNTGGTLLFPQEIRVSLYHSPFLRRLTAVNLDNRWRTLIRQAQPDLHMRDVELLLRAAAMWKSGNTYRPSVATFLNKFAATSQRYGEQEQTQINRAFDWFLDQLVPESYPNLRSERGKLIVTLFESVFAACATRWERSGHYDIPESYFQTLSEDGDFRAASDTRPTDRRNVKTRLRRAGEVLDQLLAGG